jgi:hypothetical protein
MRVLVACEFSGVVRDAFGRSGHDAWSCDLLPDDTGPHQQRDVREILSQKWDMLIGHPPCQYMSNSGALRLYRGGKKANGRDPERWAQMEAAAAFFSALWNAPIPRIAVENPVMVGHAKRLIGVRPPGEQADLSMAEGAPGPETDRGPDSAGVGTLGQSDAVGTEQARSVA